MTFKQIRIKWGNDTLRQKCAWCVVGIGRVSTGWNSEWDRAGGDEVAGGSDYVDFLAIIMIWILFCVRWKATEGFGAAKGHYMTNVLNIKLWLLCWE